MPTNTIQRVKISGYKHFYLFSSDIQILVCTNNQNQFSAGLRDIFNRHLMTELQAVAARNLIPIDTKWDCSDVYSAKRYLQVNNFNLERINILKFLTPFN